MSDTTLAQILRPLYDDEYQHDGSVAKALKPYGDAALSLHLATDT